MIQFILRIGQQTVDLKDMRDLSLKTSFEELMSSMERLLGELTCNKHHRSPVVTLQNEGSVAHLSGFGSCCGELNERVKEALRLHGYPVDGWTSATTTKVISM